MELPGGLRELLERLRAAGGRVETAELPGCDHLGTSEPTGNPDSPWMKSVHAFLNAH